MSNSNGLIERIGVRIADLKAEKASVVARLKEIDFRLDELLAVVYDAGVPILEPGVHETADPDNIPSPIESVLPTRPTDAIITLLKISNYPLSSRQIIDQLAPVVETKSNNARKVLSSLLSGLVKSRKINLDRGKYFIDPHWHDDEKRRLIEDYNPELEEKL
ncbi:MAG: hypothetical protein QM703_27580 [Gemmatales bacterium]